MLNKKIVFISIVVLSLPACQLNAGQNNFPTAFDCRCKDRGITATNQEANASVLSVNVLGVNIPPTGNGSPTPTGSATPEPSATPTTPTANPSPSASPIN